VTYTFRNRFTIGRGRNIAAPSGEHVLAESDSDGKVVLKAAATKAFTGLFALYSPRPASPGGDTKIRDTAELAVEGSGYRSFDAAVGAGRRWRQYLLEALARESIAADFGDDDDNKLVPSWDDIFVSPGNEFAKRGVKKGDRVIQDRLGLTVFKTEPQPEWFFLPGFGQVTIGINIEALISGPLAHARARSLWTPPQKLAYRLVHDSLFETNPEARYIFMVMAIEALIPEKDRIPAIVSTLERLKGVLGQWDLEEDVRDTVAKLLNDDKKESIRWHGQQLAARLNGEYDGSEPKILRQMLWQPQPSCAQ
jgi:hypothetical protein